MKFRFALVWFVLCFIFVSAAAADGDAYRVMFLGDVHYDAREYHPEYNTPAFKRNVTMWQGASQLLLKAAGEEAGRENALFVVQLGDITQGDADTPELQEKMFRAAFAKVKENFPDRPLLVVKGNHDVRDRKGKTDNGPAERTLLPLVAAEKGFEKLADGNYAFMQGKDLFIALDGFVKPKTTVAFLRKTLSAHPDARYVFLLTHLPILPADEKYPVWLQPGYAEIAAALETRRALVISAHTHRPSFTTRTTSKGILPQLVVSSMGCDWSPDKILPTPLTDWEKFVAAAQKAKLRGRNLRIPKEWPKLMELGKYTQRRDFINAGFVVLDVDDARVEARIFINASGTPAVTLRPIEGPAAAAAR